MPEPENEPQVEGSEAEGEQLPENFRRRLDQVLADNKAKDSLILDMAFRNVPGIDITKGLGKTARDNYKGDPTTEAIMAYLSDSYEWAPQPSPPAAQLGASIASAQNRIQDTGQGPGTGSGNNEATVQQQIDEAEAKGDWTRSLALKKEWFGELMFGRNRS